MKSKKTIYILGPLVLLIWALVIYRIVSYGAIEVAAPTFQESFQESIPTVFEPDSFVLHADYTEPFLIDEGTYLSQVRPLREKEAEVETIVNYPKWPEVAYLGTIGNKKKKKQLSVIRIGEKEYFFKKGEEKEDILLLKNYGDSIRLRYKSEEEKVWIKKP